MSTVPERTRHREPLQLGARRRHAEEALAVLHEVHSLAPAVSERSLAGEGAIIGDLEQIVPSGKLEDRRARERMSAGRHGQSPPHGGPAPSDDLELFGTGRR
jgi:hypothetical protein